MNKENTTELVFVKPRNKRYCQYTLNKEVHSATYDQVYLICAGLAPELSTRMNELIYSFQSFVLIVPLKKIEVLRFDKETELQALKDSLKSYKNFNFDLILKEERKREENPLNRFDGIMQKYAEKEIKH